MSYIFSKFLIISYQEIHKVWSKSHIIQNVNCQSHIKTDIVIQYGLIPLCLIYRNWLLKELNWILKSWVNVPSRYWDLRIRKQHQSLWGIKIIWTWRTVVLREHLCYGWLEPSFVVKGYEHQGSWWLQHYHVWETPNMWVGHYIW